MASTKYMSEEEYKRLSVLFNAYDVDGSGRIEKDEFFTICQELNVPSQEANGIFKRLDVDRDGSITLEEFIDGFREKHLEGEDGTGVGDEYSKREGELNTEEHVLSW